MNKIEPKKSNKRLISENSLNRIQIKPRFLKSCGCPSILIVDDQYINRFIITQYWMKFDISFEEAENGKEAVEMIRKEANKLCWEGFSLILMDLNMPVLGGIQASKLIMEDKKQHRISQDTTIIAITAFPSATLKEEWILVGMTDYKTKPFSLADFWLLVEKSKKTQM